MRRVCIGLYRDAARMGLARCVRPGRICFYCIRHDVCRLAEWCALVIRRSILNAFPCPPICLVGLAYLPMPFYLNGVGVEAELFAGMPRYCGHKVADQPYHTLLPPVGVVTCTLGNSWRGARVYIPRPRGLQFICQLADLDQLEAATAFSLGYLPWP